VVAGKGMLGSPVIFLHVTIGGTDTGGRRKILGGVIFIVAIVQERNRRPTCRQGGGGGGVHGGVGSKQTKG